ncbi:MAG: hypothetical protein OXI49_14495 [Acidobacteriota bacterium]|nr:hypothetical protein [Acidobacteriota bacterium]
MAAGDGARAWAYLRRNPDYRAAWAEHAARPVFEDGAAFPVRVLGAADRAARRFALLAWQDVCIRRGPSVRDGEFRRV